MKEKSLEKKVRAWLTARGVCNYKFHGSPYSIKNFPDIFGVLPGGRAYFIELKAPGKKPRPGQLAFLAFLAEQGAVAFWADSLEEVERRILPLLSGEVVSPNIKNCPQQEVDSA